MGDNAFTISAIRKWKRAIQLKTLVQPSVQCTFTVWWDMFKLKAFLYIRRYHLGMVSFLSTIYAINDRIVSIYLRYAFYVKVSTRIGSNGQHSSANSKWQWQLTSQFTKPTNQIHSNTINIPQYITTILHILVTHVGPQKLYNQMNFWMNSLHWK